MTKIIGRALSGAAGFGIAYLMAAFVQWSADPGAWTEGARFFTMLVGWGLGVMGVMAHFEATK